MSNIGVGCVVLIQYIWWNVPIGGPFVGKVLTRIGLVSGCVENLECQGLEVVNPLPLICDIVHQHRVFVDTRLRRSNTPQVLNVELAVLPCPVLASLEGPVEGIYEDRVMTDSTCIHHRSTWLV